ncbi:MAG: MarR family winged helix-turn-helix transcriptional regulator [Xanthobacteraceae bacterium]
MSLLVHRLTLGNSELHARGHRLTVQEWRVLSIVADSGPIEPGDIRRHGTQDKSTISWAIKRLLQRKMIVRASLARDARTFEVSLGPEGRAYYNAVVPIARRKVRQIGKALKPAETKELLRLILKIGLQPAGKKAERQKKGRRQ